VKPSDQPTTMLRPRLLGASLETLRRLERFSVSALPARASWELPGWLCLADDGGYVGRANSATPMPAAEPVGVREVAASYGDRDLAPLIRWTPEAPAATAEQLAGVGWSSAREVLVMTRPLMAEDAAVATEVELRLEATTSWRSTYQAAYEPEEGASRLRLAVAAPESKRFAELRLGGRTAGVGLGLRMDGLVGIFDVLAVPDFRRQGVARRMMLALLGWGESQGADLAFLQVASANTAAVELYSQLGFSIAYTYVYAGPGLAAAA